MYRRKRVTAIILAAGSGRRMKSDENKVYLSLGGQPIIQYSIETFAQHPCIDELVLVTRPDEGPQMEALLGTLDLPKPTRIACGGATRQESVQKALAEVKSPIVIVHDGARPFVQREYITKCMEAMDRYDGAIVALQTAEPLINTKGQAVQTEGQLYAAQTPQCFHTKILRKCHKKHRQSDTATDDSNLLEREGYKVGIVAGDGFNIKITTPLDLPVAEACLSMLEK
ncbi:MAG: 2-C-methyl-D-erythritol 4-phosphate cytidylyltransferase [Oscillospiraceae bacterium]|nr:2-C-methyl-D-erythritol 4-phosphate cytidylyltransferase [Oscillospiraceae bacterium]